MEPTGSGDPFWLGFGLDSCPDFRGKRVLEIGCGHGWRCIQAAESGADSVLGLDPLEAQLAVARATVATSSNSVRSKVSFVRGILEELPPDRFDVIISESALEHVMDVPSLLAEVRERLEPGGRFYLGFGPLYHAFDGDHGWMRDALPFRRFFPWPWGHLYLERYAMRRLSKLHGRALVQTHDWPYLDLNRLTLAEYERMFEQSGMRMAQVRRNHVRSWKSKLIASMGRLPVLSKYFTVNMYVIFEQPRP